MSNNKVSIDWYNNNASAYAAHVRNPKESKYHSYYEKPAMYDALPDLKNKKVLSLGCGSGEDCHYLKSLGAYESIGIDISEELIKIAIDSYPECIFKVMDMENLIFENESFDFVYSSLAIHYLEYWDKVFSEVYRILKPNGYFLFSSEHPTFSAMACHETKKTKTRELSYARDKETGKTVIIGDYFKHKSHTEAGWPVKKWHRTIGEISSEIKKSGFLISDIIEPKPKEEMKMVSKTTFEHLNKIPNFIIFKLYKLGKQ
jgi:ubiquinone/menaquinone biosynthesis C-methylase UbiE